MKKAEIGGITVQMIYSMVCLELHYFDSVMKTEMFQITHDRNLVYSLIKITEIKVKLEEETIEELMFLWANKTAIPYIEWLWNFKDKGHSLVKD